MLLTRSLMFCSWGRRIKQCLIPPDYDDSRGANTTEKNSSVVATEGNKLADKLSALGLGSEKSAFHKDFKIRGLTVEPGQKDRSSYISLLKQLEEGKGRGYSDKEIAYAILRFWIQQRI